MLFNSYSFLIFFPVVTLIFFLIPQKFKWIWLLAASYYFYMSWNAYYALLLFTSTLITFLSGIFIERAGSSQKLKRLAVAFSFITNLGILFFFKYYGFFFENINRILSAFNLIIDPPLFDVLLPVGISFYTFQALSYTADVYRGQIKASHNLGKYALFVSFFPQLVAGPIERSVDLLPQISEMHRFDYERMKRGLLLMLWGFVLKLVIADRLGLIVNNIYLNIPAAGGTELVLATLCFAVQIYCDFNGYSSIAIGAAEVMGFKLTRNFNLPYFSSSVREFWRRWHITLGAWFREYLYIPLGGNRKGKIRKYLNIMTVFILSGLWHGADLTFAAWGALHGGYQIAEYAISGAAKKQISRINPKLKKIIGIIITFILVCFAWIFFRAETLADAAGAVSKIFNLRSYNGIREALLNAGLPLEELMASAISVAALFIVSLAMRKGSIRDKLMRKPLPIQWTIYLAGIFAVLIFGIYGSAAGASDFIYFQF